MLNVLTPTSPLASYGSVSSSGDRLSRSHPPGRTYSFMPSSSKIRPRSDTLVPWTDNSINNKFRQHIASPYQTQTLTDAYKQPMPHFSLDGPVMASQPFSAPQASQIPQQQQQPHHHLPRPPHPHLQPPGYSPVPQPQVTYQPVSSVPQPSQPPNLDEQEHSGSDNTTIASYMQIPATINRSRGSLSEFAAQITCLFWFESISNLQRVEEANSSPPVPLTPLAADAKPTMGFMKWVTTMLSTTQVTRNVILLALMFIYRLKTRNPSVRGKSGSEYRLLTVALMLGNKFLDDNTYTNKTWADVSGISVAEIHVMEVEFLSNMRYNLFTSEEDWSAWHKKLGRFYDYFERASKQPLIDSQPQAPQTISPLPTPHTTSPPHLLHGPRHTSPPYQQSSHPSRHPHLPPPIPDPTQRIFDPDGLPRPRKRSFDEIGGESFAKKPRINVSTPDSGGLGTPGLPTPGSNAQGSDSQTPRLPLPKFAPNTQPSQHLLASMYPAQLPPLQNRAMTIVYGQSSHNQQPPPLSLQQSLGPNVSRVTMPSAPAIYDSQKPTVSQPHQVSSGSPSNLALTPTAHDHLSPSQFPINRSSPYRPVRSVHTLLVAPPSGSLQAPQDFGVSNMHYQPLGKPLSERRTGIVPFMHSDRSPWQSSWTPYNHGHT